MLVAKSHHALVDGVSAVDITTVLFDTEPDAAADAPAARGRGRRARCRPPAQLLADALVERATRPQELVRTARAVVRTPRQLLRGARDGLQAMGALAFAGLRAAPPTPLNVKVGPHRRYTWVDAELAELQRDQGRARRHRQRRGAGGRGGRARALPAPPRRRHRRASCCARSCRSSVRGRGRARARSATRSRRCGRRCRSASRTPSASTPRSATRPPSSRRAAGRRRARADRARGLRVADDHEPGRAAAAAPALLQPRRDERARARSSRCTCSGAGCGRCIRSSRSPAARRSASRS